MNIDEDFRGCMARAQIKTAIDEEVAAAAAEGLLPRVKPHKWSDIRDAFREEMDDDPEPDLECDEA